MSDHCPQDGGFIGKAGCTHPNHQHSELVKKLIDNAASPVEMSMENARAALSEGFYVTDPEGKRVGFGKNLLDKINAHAKVHPKDAKRRLECLHFAVATVTNYDSIEHDHKGLQGRTAYCKRFKDFGIMAISDPEGQNIDYVFNIIPKRSLRK